MLGVVVIACLTNWHVFTAVRVKRQKGAEHNINDDDDGVVPFFYT